jgi:hypothetical protein
MIKKKTISAHCSSPEIAFAERCPPVPEELTGNESPSSLPETMNPFLTFSSEDLKGMDKVTSERSPCTNKIKFYGHKFITVRTMLQGSLSKCLHALL